MTEFTPESIKQGYGMTEKDGGVIECAFTRSSDTPEDSTAVATNFANQMRFLLEHYNDSEALVLLELTPQDGAVSSEAKKIYSDLAKDPRIMRLAIYGGLEKYRVIANILLPLWRHTAMHVFENKDQAMSWLLHS